MPDRSMLAPAPVIRIAPGRVKLDVKFAVGMKNVCANWPGRVDCILREGAQSIPFGAEYNVDDLPFGIHILPEGAPVPDTLAQDYDIIEASGDLHLDLHLADALQSAKTRIVYVVEYDLKTRLQIVWLDPDTALHKKLRRTVWTLRQERARRKAFEQADALQTNGFPAYDSYSALNDNTLIYLDNRMRHDMFAKPDHLSHRDSRLRAGAPLRLINSGRLEPMKGAQDLIPLAKALADRKVDFQLDIYGTGSLEDTIKQGIAQHGLSDKVRLHAPVDFETELVPLSRDSADLFLSCHRQSDPSCTYLEAMGCGLPVIGYANAMLSRLNTEAQAGWTVGLGNVTELADKISQIAGDLTELHRASKAALAYAGGHDFESEFAKRRDHLLNVQGAA